LSVEQWIDQSVLSQCLSQQILCFTNNNDLLEQYYTRKFFLVYIEYCYNIRIYSLLLDFFSYFSNKKQTNINFKNKKKSVLFRLVA